MLAETRKLLPDAPVIYASDMAGLPYGTKSEAEVAARVSGLLGRMAERYNPRLICIACNTASTIALGMVREVLETPIVGTVPAIKPAALSSQTGVIGLLGTEATLRQPYVDNLEREFVTNGKLLRFPAPGLVDQAERKMRGEAVDRAVLKAAIEGLDEQDEEMRMDRIVLGCTHFPLLRDELMDIAVSDSGLSRDIQLIDSGAGIARRIVHLLEGQEFAREAPDLAVTTGSLDEFAKLDAAFATLDLGRLAKF